MTIFCHLETIAYATSGRKRLRHAIIACRFIDDGVRIFLKLLITLIAGNERCITMSRITDL